MKADNETRVRIGDSDRKIEVRLSNALSDAYVAGKTRYEIYLPKTEAWSRKLFEKGWMLKPNLYAYDIVVTNSSRKVAAKARLTGATVRYVPIRAFERADKHIVLYTKINKNE